MKKLFKFFIPLFLLVFTVTAAGCSFGLNAVIRYDNAEKYTASANGTLDSVSSLDVEWLSGRVLISSHNGENVVFSEERPGGETNDDYMLRYWLDETNTLRIRFAKSGTRIKNNYKKDLTILLPLHTELQSFQLETVSADANIVSVWANDCEIETVSGDVSCRYAHIEWKANFQSVSGDVVIEDTEISCATEIETVSGDILTKFKTLPPTLSAETVSGDIKFCFPDTGFTVTYSTVSGNFYTELEGKYQNDVFTYQDGSQVPYTAETVSGDLGILLYQTEKENS